MQPISFERTRASASVTPQPHHSSKRRTGETSWQTQAAAVAIGLLRFTGGAAARATPATPELPALPQSRSLLQVNSSLETTVFAPVPRAVASAPQARAPQGGAPVSAPATAPAPLPLESTPFTPPPLSDQDIAQYCNWLFTPASPTLEVAFSRQDLIYTCRDQISAHPEPLTYLKRERAAGELPGAGNFTRISVLGTDQNGTGLSLANHTFGNVLANFTARTRAYVSPFWPRSQGPIDDGFVGAELVRPGGQEGNPNTTRRLFNWLFGQKLAHRNPLSDGFNATDPDLIGNIPGLSGAISEDSQRISPGLALNRWLGTVTEQFRAVPGVNPWPSNLRYNATGLWASGTSPLAGDVMAAPDLFVQRYQQLPALLDKAGIAADAQNTTLTAYRNIVNYGLYNLGQPTL